MKLTIRPLTPDLWPALEDLFGARGACGGCWCMYCRIGSEYKRRPAAANKADLREIVRQGPPPGLIAFDGDLAVGWCQLTPRDDVPWLDRTWRLARVDDLPVWSLSCMYVRIGYRRRGVSRGLLDEAVRVARRAKAAPGGLSVRCRGLAEFDEYGLRLDVCPRWLQGGRAAHPGASDHAPRSQEDHLTISPTAGDS